MLLLPCCLQPSLWRALEVEPFSTEQSSPSCVWCCLKINSRSENKKESEMAMGQGRAGSYCCLLPSHGSQDVSPLCVVWAEWQMLGRGDRGDTAVPLPHGASSVFCDNRVSSGATSDLQSNSNEQDRQGRGQRGAQTWASRSLSSEPSEALTWAHLPVCPAAPGQ